MRIAVVSDCFSPHMGGIETQVEGLAHRLQNQGHQVEILTATRAGKFVGRRKENGLWVHRLGMPAPDGIALNPFAAPLMKAILPRFDVVQVHLGVISPFAQLALKVLADLSVPTLATFHCTFGPWKNLLRPVLKYSAAARSGIAFSAVSEMLSHQLKTFLPARQEVYIIPNGIDHSFWEQARGLTTAAGLTTQTSPTSAAESSFPAEVPGSKNSTASCLNALGPTPRRLCTQGEKFATNFEPIKLVSAIRLMPRKRPWHLINLVKSVNQELGYPALQLKIFGEGGLRPLLAHQISWTKQEQTIQLCGRADTLRLRAEYAQADAFITLCIQESFGIAAAEAIGAGLPVIARSDSAVSDLVTDGITGILGSDDQQIAQKLIRAISAPVTKAKPTSAASLTNGKAWSREGGEVAGQPRPERSTLLQMRQEVCASRPVTWEKSLSATLDALHWAIQCQNQG